MVLINFPEKVIEKFEITDNLLERVPEELEISTDRKK
jgi:hypothetical protein